MYGTNNVMANNMTSSQSNMLCCLDTTANVRVGVGGVIDENLKINLYDTFLELSDICSYILCDIPLFFCSRWFDSPSM